MQNNPNIEEEIFQAEKELKQKKEELERRKRDAQILRAKEETEERKKGCALLCHDLKIRIFSELISFFEKQSVLLGSEKAKIILVDDEESSQFHFLIDEVKSTVFTVRAQVVTQRYSHQGLERHYEFALFASSKTFKQRKDKSFNIDSIVELIYKQHVQSTIRKKQADFYKLNTEAINQNFREGERGFGLVFYGSMEEEGLCRVNGTPLSHFPIKMIPELLSLFEKAEKLKEEESAKRTDQELG